MTATELTITEASSRGSDSDHRTYGRINIFIHRVDDAGVGNTIAEDFLVGRRAYTHADYRPLVTQFLNNFLGLRNHDGSTLKFRWSNKAGCGMCPCSPGFVVNVKNLDRSELPYDGQPGYHKDINIWLTVQDTFAVTDIRAAVAIATEDDSASGMSLEDLGIEVPVLADEPTPEAVVTEVALDDDEFYKVQKQEALAAAKAAIAEALDAGVSPVSLHSIVNQKAGLYLR